ncbi:MAG: hypothetical protein WD036_09915 [Bauldia sp.]
MTILKESFDFRPFQSRAELEREAALIAQYRRLAIPELVAAIQQMAGAPGPVSAKDDQMR